MNGKSSVIVLNRLKSRRKEDRTKFFQFRCGIRSFIPIFVLAYVAGLIFSIVHANQSNSHWGSIFISDTDHDDELVLQQDLLLTNNNPEDDDGAITIQIGEDDDDDGGNEDENRDDVYDHDEQVAAAVVKLPLPIMNVGFPKAGTSSIFEFFRCNGLRAQHWYCCGEQDSPSATSNKTLMSSCILDNLANKRSLLDGCGDYDVYAEMNGPRRKFGQDKKQRGQLLDDGTFTTQHHTRPAHPRVLLPQHHYLDMIHDQYPNATFILNLRPVDAWVTSVLRWPTSLRFELGSEFYAQQTERTWASEFSPQKHEFAPWYSKSKLQPFLKWLYEYHNQFVRAFVKQYPSHTLVEVDISSEDAGQVLADAFDLDSTCWGHMNQNNRPGRLSSRLFHWKHSARFGNPHGGGGHLFSNKERYMTDRKRRYVRNQTNISNTNTTIPSSSSRQIQEERQRQKVLRERKQDLFASRRARRYHIGAKRRWH